MNYETFCAQLVLYLKQYSKYYTCFVFFNLKPFETLYYNDRKSTNFKGILHPSTSDIL